MITSADLACFSPLSRQFALRIAAWSAGASDAVVWAAALVSHFRSEGHTCLPLDRVAGRLLSEVIDRAPSSVRLPGLTDWMDALDQSGVVMSPARRPSDLCWGPSGGDSTAAPAFTVAPLVLESSFRLYLHRYWTYEQEAAANLKRRSAHLHAWDPARLSAAIRHFFPLQPDEAFDWQALAAYSALRRGLTVISGGPGTGKTRTVARHLAALFALAASEGTRWPRVSLTAPTGKAAARLTEAIRQAMEDLPVGSARSPSMVFQATTLHRLLGFSPFATESNIGTPVRLLASDVVVVDEASMMDIALLVRLLRALPETTRLVLVGDQDQLAAVEAGSILGEMWSGPSARQYSPGWAVEVLAHLGRPLPADTVNSGATPLSDSMVELHRSHRFGTESAIQVFSRGVRSRDIRLARSAWRGTVPGLKLVPTSSAAHRLTDLMERLIPWHQRLVASPSPTAALGVLKELRLLSPLRHGPLGVESLNRDIQRRMARQGLIPAGRDWYSGRPVLVTSTDMDLGLSNGDTGLALTDPVDGRLLVWFETPDGELRSLSPLRMPPHETAFVMTVHKSQGSEFNEVVLLIPDEPHPLVSREMIYTAVTRARTHAEVWGTEESLLAGLGRATERFSGLGEALWGDIAATERTLRSTDHPAVTDSTDT